MLCRIEVTPRGFHVDPDWIPCIVDVRTIDGKHYIPETFRGINEAKNWMRLRATTLAEDAASLQMLRSDIHYCNRLCYDNYCLEIRTIPLND